MRYTNYNLYFSVFLHLFASFVELTNSYNEALNIFHSGKPKSTQLVKMGCIVQEGNGSKYPIPSALSNSQSIHHPFKSNEKKKTYYYIKSLGILTR